VTLFPLNDQTDIERATRISALMRVFGNLRPFGGFKMIMADPPWKFETHSNKGLGKSADAHYNCMSLQDIKDMPVSFLAAEDCMLWLWTTTPCLPQAFEVIDAWGFTYSTEGVWVKRTKNGHLGFGTGYRLRNSHEPFLIATKGSPKIPKDARNIRSVIEAQLREHSRKPDEAFQIAERMSPHSHRIELFSRENRPGWRSYGNETGLFDTVEGAKHG